MLKEVFINDTHRQMKKYFLHEMKNLGKAYYFEKNQRIDPKHSIGSFKIVLSGIIKISLISEDGKNRLFHLIRKGEVYDEYGKFEQDEVEIVAKEDSAVLYFSFDDIPKLDDPLQCMEYLLHSMHRKYSLLKFQTLCTHFDSIDGQIASVLLRTAYQSGCPVTDGRIELDYPFTHDEMADIIGCSRVTVTRHIHNLVDRGLIGFRNRYIVINDVKALEAYTQVK